MAVHLFLDVLPFVWSVEYRLPSVERELATALPTPQAFSLFA